MVDYPIVDAPETDYSEMETVLVENLLEFEPRLTTVVLGNQQISTREVDYPYCVFYWLPEGVADWEMDNRYIQDQSTVTSEDPDFEDDVEVDYTVDWRVNLQLNIVGESDDPIASMAQKIESYGRNQFQDDLRRADIDTAGVQSTSQGGVVDEKRGDTARRMAQRTVILEMIVINSYTVTVENIEQVRFSEPEFLKNNLIPEDE